MPVNLYYTHLLSEERLSPREEKPCGFVRHCFANLGKKNGGERGIRTLGQLPVAGLANLCFRPLSHLSAYGEFLQSSPQRLKSFIFMTYFARRIPSSSVKEIYLARFSRARYASNFFRRATIANKPRRVL